MRSILLVGVLSLLCLTTATAQEPAICGNWTGTFLWQHEADSDNWHWCNRKLHIRIYKHEDYGLKLKTVPGEGACNKCPTWYGEECIITHIDDKAIDFYEKQNWGRNEWGGAEICENHYSLSYSNGTLRLNPIKRIIIEYDRYGNIVKKDDVTHRAAWILHDIILYKGENDW